MEEEVIVVSFEESIGYVRKHGVGINANDDGWKQEDVDRLASLLPPELKASEADTRLRQKSIDVIPWLQFGVGAAFGAFCTFMGTGAAQALKDYIVRRSRDFETLEGFRFHKGNFNGSIRGVNVEVAINCKDHHTYAAALDKWHDVAPLVEDLIETHGAQNIRVLRIIYGAKSGRWILNMVDLNGGRHEFGPLDEVGDL